jgi:DNA invertase Pin-like site-specific DNA recombinase
MIAPEEATTLIYSSSLQARQPGVDAVVVLRLDRLGRDAAECLALLAASKKAIE